jgi:acylphosphatase
MKRLHIIVKGRVQGVFYRQFTKDNARRLELKGWVRNTHDGNVEAVFEGEKDKILEMLELCREGSQAANVEDIDLKWEEYKGEFNGFNVRY